MDSNKNSGKNTNTNLCSNDLIIKKLSELSQIYSFDKSKKFKKNAIDNALNEIKLHKNKINSGKYAQKNIKKIGEGISKRIDEILTTGELSEIKEYDSILTPDNTNSNNNSSINNKIRCINELKRITGMGETRAKSLYDLGIRSIGQYKNEIEKGNIKSTHHIDVGIKYLNDFEIRIPREEIKKMEIILKDCLSQLNSNNIFNICGSYRRGSETCGDIDILISNKSNKSYLTEYVKLLKDRKFLIDDLTNKGEKKYMGVCKIDKIARRIDIRFINYESYYSALLYFTGSKNFNLYVRNEALKRNYSLSEYGMKNKINGKLILVDSEEDIFSLLGLEYVKPTDRNI